MKIFSHQGLCFFGQIVTVGMNDIFPDATERGIAIEVFIYLRVLQLAHLLQQLPVIFTKWICVYKLRQVDLFRLAGIFFILFIGFSLYCFNSKIRVRVCIKIKNNAQPFAGLIHHFHFFFRDHGHYEALRRLAGKGSRGNSLYRSIQHFQKGFPFFIGKFKFTGEVIIQTIAIYLQQLILFLIPVSYRIKIEWAVCI